MSTQLAEHLRSELRFPNFPSEIVRIHCITRNAMVSWVQLCSIRTRVACRYTGTLRHHCSRKTNAHLGIRASSNPSSAIEPSPPKSKGARTREDGDSSLCMLPRSLLAIYLFQLFHGVHLRHQYLCSLQRPAIARQADRKSFWRSPILCACPRPPQDNLGTRR